MRRKHLLLLCLALACSCLCFLLLDPHAHEVPEPRSEPMRAVVGEAPAVEVPIRALHETAVADKEATEHTDLETTKVSSASPTTTSVEPPSLAKSPPAFIAGTVVVPSEWELKSFQLDFSVYKSHEQLRDIESSELRRIPERADAYSWSLPGVRSGRNEVVVFPTLFSMQFDVGPEGRQDIEIDVPPPSSVEVHVVDALTKAPSRVAWLDHAVLMKEPALEELEMTTNPFEQLTMQSSWWRTFQENEGKAGVFRFKAPQGSLVWLQTRDTAFSGAATNRTDTFRALEPGRNKLELFINNDVGGFILRAKDGEKFVSWPTDCTVDAEAVDGAGTVQVWDDDGARGHRAFVSVPGKYRCQLSKIKGFASLDPFEVEVLEGTFKQVTVELKREP
jgi:hypothetical protein